MNLRWEFIKEKRKIFNLLFFSVEILFSFFFSWSWPCFLSFFLRQDLFSFFSWWKAHFFIFLNLIFFFVGSVISFFSKNLSFIISYLWSVKVTKISPQWTKQLGAPWIEILDIYLWSEFEIIFDERLLYIQLNNFI